MEWITLPSRPSAADLEGLYSRLRSGARVMLRASDGDHASLRAALARHGFMIDAVDGGAHGFMLLPLRACA